jgi:hypothetical protein
VTALRWLRRTVTAGIALVVLFAVVATGGEDETQVVPAADLSAFRAGNIISNAVFFDSTAMSVGQIQSFLNGQGASCRATKGAPCLKDYAMATSTRAADSYCPGRYVGAGRESAAAIVAKVAIACDISPRVLLVTLQKEMGLVTSSGPTVKMYTRAMGYACPDSSGGTCDSAYNGLFNQLYSAAKQFQRYAARPTGYSYEAGVDNQIKWHPSSACGTSTVYIENQATAGLYNYTPYRPNSAALAAGYGLGDSCSSYGNRNFWNYFTDWFGSTQTGGYDPDAPVGRVDRVTGGPGTISVRGWAFDPNAKTSALNVHVYVDGRVVGAVRTGDTRSDVAAAYSGVGTQQGFSGTVDAAPGVRTACLYAVNLGKGWTNPRLGCATVTVATEEALNPQGTLDRVSLSGTTATIHGWTLDPDVPTAPVKVHVSVDGRVVTAVAADEARADIGRAYPAAGSAHGYSWSGEMTAGRHQICAYAINQEKGTANPRLGCGSVVVDPALSNPLGSLDGVAVTGSTVTARGWAFDPDDPTAPLRVHVYVDGRVLTAVTASATRADIGQAYAEAGADHGYTWSGTLSAGTHQVCTYAINQGAGTGHPRLGCKSVTVAPVLAASGSGNPRGSLDRVLVSGTTATLRGWTFDPDVPTTPLTVHVYVDGRTITAVGANESRTDIGAAYPTAGDLHGYSWTGTLSRGTHQVCTYAINRGPGTANPRLGCKSVTVS